MSKKPPKKRDLFQELKDSTDPDMHPPSWKPAPGDVVAGVVVAFNEVSTVHGPCKVVIIDNEDGSGPLSIWLGTKVLQSKFENERPQIGDRIGVKRFSDHPEKAYHRYELKVERGADYDDPAAEAVPF